MDESRRPKRPFKICNHSRDQRKGIACSSLEELKHISRERFGLNTQCRVFLESDGTEVDNEEYFQFLPPQTLFLVTNNEDWVGSSSHSQDVTGRFSNNDTFDESQESYHGYDEPDGPSDIASLSPSLMQRIHHDPLFFVSSSTDELELISEFGAEKLSKEINISLEHAQFIVDKSEQEITKRLEIKQTHDLLSVCHEAINRLIRVDRDANSDSVKRFKACNE